MDSSDLLLHPVRLRIVQALLGDRELTTSQLAAELDDVSPATVYRQVAVLAEAGVLAVVRERKARGVSERTYALRIDATRMTPEALAAMSKDEHAAMFRAFIAGLLGDYDRYLAAGEPDLIRDGVRYTMGTLWLSDAELEAFVGELRRVFESRADFAPRPDRRRRIISSVIMPGAPATKAAVE